MSATARTAPALALALALALGLAACGGGEPDAGTAAPPAAVEDTGEPAARPGGTSLQDLVVDEQWRRETTDRLNRTQ